MIKSSKIVDLYSNHFDNSKKCKKLDSSIIIDELLDAEKAIICSAYYSNDFLKNFLKAIPKVKRKKIDLTFIFHGFAGRRLKKQRTELKRIITHSQKILKVKKLNILLNTSTALFHSKLYYFASQSSKNWFIGSANCPRHVGLD